MFLDEKNPTVDTDIFHNHVPQLSRSFSTESFPRPENSQWHRNRSATLIVPTTTTLSRQSEIRKSEIQPHTLYIYDFPRSFSLFRLVSSFFVSGESERKPSGFLCVCVCVFSSSTSLFLSSRFSDGLNLAIG